MEKLRRPTLVRILPLETLMINYWCGVDVKDVNHLLLPNTLPLNLCYYAAVATEIHSVFVEVYSVLTLYSTGIESTCWSPITH